MSESDEVPYTMIGGHGPVPWKDLPLTCPECGEGPLPLESSDPPMLSFIHHCGKSWLRGPMNV